MPAHKINVFNKDSKERSFLGFFKHKVPEIFWQKGSPDSSLLSPFTPSNYSGKNNDERKENAFHDAKNTLNFYKGLIKADVFPEGTKVKVKRTKHRNSYHLEFFMPDTKHIPEYHTVSSEAPIDKYLKKRDKKKVDNLHSDMESIRKKIKDLAEKFGYNGEMHEDVWAPRNYGLDKDGNVKLIDVEVFKGYLIPDKKANRVRRGCGGRFNLPGASGVLEKKLTSILIIFLISMFFLFIPITINGNVSKSYSFILTENFSLLFVALFISLVFIWIKKNNFISK